MTWNEEIVSASSTTPWKRAEKLAGNFEILHI